MTDETAYQRTLDYLYSFVDYSLQRNFRNEPGRFDLARMAAFAAALGNPQQQYPIVHIAGTKGKGSVAAFCASALRTAGYRVGLYTSPHLIDYTERLQINGEPIAQADLVALVEEIKPQIAAIPELTTFEITTALAFLYFARQKADAAVIEVGLGGRLDATNIVLPKVAVITSLSYDHMALLGDTLGLIAGEKGGIIKTGVPVVLAPQKEEARQVVVNIALERNAPLVQVGEAVQFEPLSHSLDGQSCRVWEQSAPEKALALTIPLLGAHQIENAATAYAALHAVNQGGLVVSEAAMQTGFASVIWPGRFELIRRSPPVVLDCAHNRDSALRLRQALDDYFPGWPIVMMFGASEDKDISGMFSELLPRVREIIFTKSFHPRAIDPEQLVELAAPYSCRVHVVPAVESALDEALRVAGNEALLLVTGSIFVVAGVREEWMKKG